MDYLCKNSEWTVKTGNWLIFLQDHLTMNASLHFIDDNPSTSDDIHTYNTNIRKNSIILQDFMLVFSEGEGRKWSKTCGPSLPVPGDMANSAESSPDVEKEHPVARSAPTQDLWRTALRYDQHLWPDWPMKVIFQKFIPLKSNTVKWPTESLHNQLVWKTPAIRPFFRSTSPTCQCWSKD